MPFQSIPNCAELIIRGTVGAKAVANVIGFNFGAAYAQPAIDALAAAADGSVTTYYKPLMTAGMTYDGVEVRGLTSTVDLFGSNSSGAGTGGVSGAQLNNNVTLCVTLRSGLTGRSARGRFYAFPTGASQLSAANLFSTTYGNALVAFLDNLRLVAAGAGWQCSILSRRNNNALRPVGVAFGVLDVELRNYISDSQRGRLPLGH